GRKELEALLDSMQEAVLAVSRDRRIQWSNGPMRSIVPVAIGSPLIGAIRDPEVLASIETALESKQVHTARATVLIPGRTFRLTATPLPAGGAVAVFHVVSSRERVKRQRPGLN